MVNSFQTEWPAPELESLASLAENIVYRLPGCDNTLVRKTLQEVAREFVADTQCLTSRQRLELCDGGMCYPYPFFGGKVAEVREVWKFNRRLRKGVDWNWPVGSGLRIAPHLLPPRPPHPDSPAQPSPDSPAQPGVAQPGVSVDLRRYPPLVNIIGAMPPVDDAPPPSMFSAVVVEHLPLFFEQLPSEFLHMHGDAICAGVLARLFSMTGRAWSDAQQAVLERTNYDNAKSELRMKREMPADGRAIDTSEVL